MSKEKLMIYITKRIKELRELENIYWEQGKKEEYVARRYARFDLEDIVEIINSGVLD